MNKKHYRTCNLCEAMCGLEITYEDKNIISIKGDKKDVFSQGHICPKAVALRDLHFDKDRLKTPIKKTKNGWIDISWEDAINEVVENLKTIQKKYGNNAVATYQGNPSVHNLGLMLFGKPFIKSLKTNQKYTASSVDQLPHHIVSLLMFGHQMMIPIPDIDRTDYLLIVGANPAVSNGSMLTAPNFSGKIKAIQKRGGKVINVDPRFTETSKISSKHVYIKPGRDALFLLALIHVVFKNNLFRKGHLENHLKNWQLVEEIAKDFSPEKVTNQIGISVKEIEKIAKDFATSKTAVCYGRLGVSTQEFGGICIWLVNVLNLITANTDSVGGAMFTLPAIDLVGMSAMQGRTGSFNRYRSSVNDLPEYSGEFPVATLADEILVESKNQIKAFVSIAGNPVLSTPNGKKLDKALESLDYMVSIDIYLNETSKHANIILPTTTGLETSNYDLAFHQLAVKNTVKFSKNLFEKEDFQRHDWQVLNALTEKISGIKNEVTPEKMLDQMLCYSPYKKEGLSVEKLKKQPHGIDFGYLKPCLTKRIFTEDKKIDLAPESVINDVNRLKTQHKKWYENESTKYPFFLIGRRQLRNNNSWMHNLEVLIKGSNRCTMFVNTNDALALSLEEGEFVKVISNVGEIEISVAITDQIMKGVMSIPHGFGHQRSGTDIKLAKKNAGVSINDLTNDKKVDELTGNADFSGTKIKIKKMI